MDLYTKMENVSDSNGIHREVKMELIQSQFGVYLAVCLMALIIFIGSIGKCNLKENNDAKCNNIQISPSCANGIHYFIYSVLFHASFHSIIVNVIIAKIGL